jgi:hypothetical protein
VSFELGSVLASTAADGVVLRGTMILLAGCALLVLADLAGQRAPEGTAISNWWLVPIALAQILTLVPALKICFALLPSFPFTGIVAFDFVTSLVHGVLAVVIGVAAASLSQQIAINLGRRFTGFMPNAIDWPYADAIRRWLVKDDTN